MIGVCTAESRQERTHVDDKPTSSHLWPSTVFIIITIAPLPSSTPPHTHHAHCSSILQGLFFPGVGLYACPVDGQATERLAVIPLMGDKMNVCSELKPVNSFISRLWLPDFVFDTSDPMIDHLSNWEYLAHHIPSITYDGLLRMLQAGLGTSKPDACLMKALTLDQCIVSTKCSGALRPAGTDKCRWVLWSVGNFLQLCLEAFKANQWQRKKGRHLFCVAF